MIGEMAPISRSGEWVNGITKGYAQWCNMCRLHCTSSSLPSLLRLPYTPADGPHVGFGHAPEVVHDVVWKRTSTGQMFLYLCYLATGTALRCIEATWHPG